MTDIKTLDDKLYEILDAFALEYLEAHMEPGYGIGQRLQVEAELVQDVKKQINLYIEEKIKEGKLGMLDKMCSRQEDGSFWYIDMAGWEVEEWYEEMKAELEQ